MQIVKYNLGEDGEVVELCAYILEQSKEMPLARKRPAVLVLPGGGYRYCSDREAEPIAAAFLAEGYNAFVLRYSVGEKASFQAALTDAEDALDIILRGCEGWSIDPSKIAVIGFSAGGHLAAALAAMGKKKPAAAILAYPCILENLGSSTLQFKVPSIDKEVKSDMPPTFIFHTTDDATVPVANSILMSYALTKHKIPYELHIFAKGAHGLSLGKKLVDNGSGSSINPVAAKWLPMCFDWLEATLRPFG